MITAVTTVSRLIAPSEKDMFEEVGGLCFDNTHEKDDISQLQFFTILCVYLSLSPFLQKIL